MENLAVYTTYEQFKQELDTEVRKIAESFVKIGYLLNIAATTDILLESGYENVNEMAEKEYKLDASQTSRFIHIYREFGVEGQPMLQEKYKEHGVAKLGLMLTMPEYIRNEISADYSKSEINELKKMVEEENKITDLEVLIEEKTEVQQALPEGFKQLVMQFVKDYPEDYVKIYDAITLDDLKEIMAPNGECTYKIRVPGAGLHLLFAKVNENIVITNARNGDKEIHEWEQFFEALKDYFVMGENAKDSWSNVFKEPYPVKEEPVKAEPSKPAKPDKNNVQQSKPKKESKVKVPAQQPKKDSKPEPKVEEEKEPEEQLPGQMDITQYPDYLSESMKEDKSEVLTGEVVDAEGVIKDTENVIKDVENVIKDVEDAEKPQNENMQQSQDDMKIEYIAPVQDAGTEHVISGLKNVLKASVDTLGVLAEKEDWAMVISKATDIVHRAKKIMELEGKN